MAPFSALPAELVDNIIDICSDKRTFYACSLVCKSWLPASRYHILHAVELLDRDHSQRFLDLISAPHSTFPKYFRKLRVCIEVPEDHDWLEKTLLPSLKKANVILESISLEVFWGMGAQDRPEEEQDRIEMMCSFPLSVQKSLQYHLKDQLVVLQLWHRTTPYTSLTSILEFLSVFQKLEFLLLVGDIGNVDIPPDWTVKPPPRLRSVDLDLPATALENIVGWFMAQKPMTKLDFFRVHGLPPSPLPLIQAYLDVSPELSCVAFSYHVKPDFPVTPDDFPIFDLKNLTRLRKVFVCLFGPVVVRPVLRTMQTVSSGSYLKSVEIDVRIYQGDKSVEDWHKLDDFLVNKLKVPAVQVNCMNNIKSSMPEPMVRRVLLPACQAKRLITIELT